MVFNEDFDRSLWLMLLDDNNINREKILYFIRVMPDKIYDSIRRVIEANSRLCYANSNNSTPQTLMMFKDEAGYEYLFKCKISFGQLQISFNRCNEHLNVCETFELSLNSLSVKRIFNISKCGSTEIGRVKWSIDKMNYEISSIVDKRESMDVKYQMTGISNSNIVIISDDLKGNFRRSKLSCEEMAPDEFTRDTLSTQIRKKGFLRTRKKKK